MERINLKKFGFERYKEADFTDDGSYFFCYKIGNVSVSKCLYNGDVFLSGRIEDDRLNYDECSKLPHYRDLDKLNGVSIATLTEQDLQNLADACRAYEKEYEEAVNNLQPLDLNLIRTNYEQIKAKAQEYEAQLESNLSVIDILLQMSSGDSYTLRSTGLRIRLIHEASNLDIDLAVKRACANAAYFRHHNFNEQLNGLKKDFDYIMDLCKPE